MGRLKGRPVSAWGFGRGFFRGQKLFFIGAARLLTLFSVGVGGLFLSDFTLEVLAYVFGCGLARMGAYRSFYRRSGAYRQRRRFFCGRRGLDCGGFGDSPLHRRRHDRQFCHHPARADCFVHRRGARHQSMPSPSATPWAPSPQIRGSSWRFRSSVFPP